MCCMKVTGQRVNALLLGLPLSGCGCSYGGGEQLLEREESKRIMVWTALSDVDVVMGVAESYQKESTRIIVWAVFV